ncbi:NPR1/NIM1-like C-terminal protein [Dioscorea alata]|uniref:NPR1/NIM1-like C-terminal protein n=1 Tax=Dioscorea alata TaxID=55571 RepID=A0ACB7WFC4_DIOAL|nr:NPR1/NIM1-like C-terminal protein [Dioscorea alata]
MELSYSATALSDTATSAAGSAAADEALRRLSDNFATLLHSPDLADGFIIIKGEPDHAIPVHRCVLSARCPFFRGFFSKIPKGEEPRIEMKDLVTEFEVGVDALNAVLGYVYSGRVGLPPGEPNKCADEDCLHRCCKPAVDFELGVLITSSKFEISELVSLYQRRLCNVLEFVVIDDVLRILSVVYMHSHSCMNLFTKCIKTVAHSDLETLTLEKALPKYVVKQVMDLRPNPPPSESQSADSFNNHVKKLYSALDSDDFELVKLLLDERRTSLDDSCALHYAVSHCHPKIVKRILDLELANINHKNSRGYTVLHCAAIRKEPEIIMSVLNKGARSSETTPDGRKALQIFKRLTKYVDYKRPGDEVKSLTRDQLCIRLLEQAEIKDSVVGEPSVFHPDAGDDLHDMLSYLEDRVNLARSFFPLEAELAMATAEGGGALKFFVSTTLDETQEQKLSRKKALSETGILCQLIFDLLYRHIQAREMMYCFSSP